VTRRVYLLVGMWASRGAPSRGARAASRRRGVMASRASTFASTGEDWRAFASGTAAGALSALALQPLDVLKTRLQVQDEVDARRARYAGAWRGARRIVAEEGARGLFAGTTPAVVGSAVSWGTYFAWYDAARTRYARASASASAASREGGDGSVVKGLPASVNALAAREAMGAS